MSSKTPDNSQETPNDSQHEQDLAQYRAQLLDQIYASYREIDHTILIVATGALVLSIGLLTNFTSLFSLWLVRVSWASLLATLIAQTLSHLYSIKSLKKQVDLVDAGNPEGENKWKKCVVVFNVAARILLVIGISCLAWYAFDNLELTPKIKH